MAGVAGIILPVFVLPPSLESLEARLRTRAGDSPAEIARRMDAAHGELSHWAEFDHVVINLDLDRAIAEVRAVLHAARSTIPRQPGLAAFVDGLYRP